MAKEKLMSQSLDCNNCNTRFLVDDQSENQCPACGIGVGLPPMVPIGVEYAKVQTLSEELTPDEQLTKDEADCACCEHKRRPIDDGGPAFPRAMGNMGDADTIARDQGAGGMTLRDFFAAHAPPMPLSIWGTTDLNLHTDADCAGYLAVIAMWRYLYADAMIEQRKEKQSDQETET